MSDINIHVGAPKCMSTSIQAALHQSPQIRYFGMIPGKDPVKWYQDNTIQMLFDADLKYNSRAHFEKNRKLYEKYFIDNLTDISEAKYWMSNENLCTRFTLEEVDCFEKISRLLSLLGNHKFTIHILFRKYKSAIYSMYTELVSRKYSKTYQDFLGDLYFYKDFGIMDHIIPNRFFKNIELVRQSYPNLQLKIYCPADDNQMLSKDLLEKVLGIKLDSHYNRINFDINTLLELNKNKYANYDLSSLMEIHRYGLALANTGSFDIWQDRVIRKKLLALGQKNDITIDYEDSILFKSNIYKLIVDEQSEVMPQNQHDHHVIGSFNNLF